MSNLKLWESLHETDPRYTKPFDRGGFRGTAINATYVVKRLTEAFGPCGLGWKFVIDDEKIIDGPDDERLHVIRGHIDYLCPPTSITDKDGNKSPMLPAQWVSTGQQFGQTKLCINYSSGLKFDEEAPKKSVTDCMTKCASLLGIAADVHMGLYDDSKYVNTLDTKYGKPVDGKGKPKADTAKLPLDKQKALYDAVFDAGLKEAAFFKKYAIKHYENLPESQYEQAMQDIADYVKNKGEKS